MASPEAVEAFVTDVTGSDAWLALDPSWRHVVETRAKARRFGKRRVIRVTPLLASPHGPIAVEGADRVITVEGGTIARTKIGAPLVSCGQFRLEGQQALLAAIRAVPGSLLDERSARESRNLARPIYLRVGNSVRAAWRVRVPTLHLADLSDVWVDADTGAILRKAPVARFASHTEVQP